MVDRQLEFGLGAGRRPRLVARDNHKRKRGHQWFQLMRQAVDADPSKTSPLAEMNRSKGGSKSERVEIKRAAQPGTKAEKSLFILPL